MRLGFDSEITVTFIKMTCIDKGMCMPLHMTDGRPWEHMDEHLAYVRWGNPELLSESNHTLWSLDSW